MDDNENNQIETRVLPGFMELLPRDQITFTAMKDTIESVFKLYGFSPIDTPSIERAEVLLAKAGGETEKQIYAFKKGDNDLALRFDLTVPLARYVAEHGRDLAFPFRRYAIGKVWRGESPQKGRFREFYQCDIDIVGNEELSLLNDAEIPSVIYSVFSKLNIGKFQIKISNRKLIIGLLESLNIQNLSVEVMRNIDKLDKIGKVEVVKNLEEIGVSKESIETVFGFLDISGSNDEILTKLVGLNISTENFGLGIKELKEVIENLRKLNVPEENFAVDLSIARGLDYYTGTVYETNLIEYPKLGSICSGGRYDDLASKYTNKKYPGVGISIGLTRLFSQLIEIGLIKNPVSTTAKVLVIPLISQIAIPLQIAADLRGKNIPTEIYLEENKMKSKLAYADKIGVKYVILVGEDEISSNKFALKNMETGEQKELSLQEISKNIQ